MQLNLNDPDSIISWWKVLPDRHQSYLEFKLSISSDFAPNIRAALSRIAVDPDLAGLLKQALQKTRDHEAHQAQKRERLSSLQLRHHELATA